MTFPSAAAKRLMKRPVSRYVPGNGNSVFQRCPAGTGSVESVILTFGSDANSAREAQKTPLADLHYVDLKFSTFTHLRFSL